MPTSNLEVLRKPMNTDMDIATHAIAWEPLCYPLYSLMKFLRFPSYKISTTLLLNSNMSGQSFLHPQQRYVILLKSNQILSDYILNPLDFCSLCTELRRCWCNFSHCSLNHSLIGCWFMVSINLLSSTKLFSALKMLFLIFNFRLCRMEWCYIISLFFWTVCRLCLVISIYRQAGGVKCFR